MVLKNNTKPSEYELRHITWSGIEYDREKLIQFVETYEFLEKSKKNPDHKAELLILDSILKEHNLNNLQKLLDNEPQYSKWAVIEKYSRLATVDLALEGKYSKEVFKIISNLPLEDYKLVVKRTKELIKVINETTADVEVDTSSIPGIK